MIFLWYHIPSQNTKPYSMSQILYCKMLTLILWIKRILYFFHSTFLPPDLVTKVNSNNRTIFYLTSNLIQLFLWHIVWVDVFRPHFKGTPSMVMNYIGAKLFLKFTTPVVYWTATLLAYWIRSIIRNHMINNTTFWASTVSHITTPR